jgi:uncharacterized membrane protein
MPVELRNPMTDQQMDRIIGNLLRAGVALAAAVVLGGEMWHIAQMGSGLANYKVFRGEPSELRSAAGVLRGVCQGHSPDLIQLGLLLLIATPVARVAFCVWAFAAQRDRAYVVITLIVLAALVLSLTGAV